MVAFVLTLIILILVTLVLQVITKMKLVSPSRLAVVHGKGKDFRIYRGGRVFVLPLINRFSTMDLTPQTNTVVVESAIAKGIVPLTVKATVSIAVSRTAHGMINAVKRILYLTNDWTELNNIAIYIIEGHLRDSIAAMTPEEVMSHKDRLIQNMIQTCKADLEGIGLEITTMNIADVEDHRLDGVKEPDLYIALLKRIQTANADSQSREAKATARAAAKEQEESRRADVSIRALENERQSIEAQTRVRLATENQRKAVGVQEATRNAESEVAGLHAQVEAEKQKVEMVKAQLEATSIIPARAEADKMVQNAGAEAANIRGRAQAELNQLCSTVDILQTAGDEGLTAYLIEKFGGLVQSFAETMDLFPVQRVSVIAGRRPEDGPISAIHPGAIDANLNQRIADILGAVAVQVPAKLPAGK
jgi:flotillin